MNKTTVVNKYKEDYDVYIGRPSKWGNPFVVNKKGDFSDGMTREQVIERYKEYLKENPQLIEDAKTELKGKRLGCFCKPKACHGDVLASIANGEDW